MITQQGLQRASAFENRHYITLPESPALAAALKMTIGPAHQLLSNFLPSTSPLVEVSGYCVLTTPTHTHTASCAIDFDVLFIISLRLSIVSVCICVSVICCAYVCVFACLCVCALYVCMYVCMYVRKYVCMFLYTPCVQ